MEPMSFIKVACLQPDVFPAQPDRNVKSILNGILAANKEGAMVLVTPELSLSGYSCGDWFLRDDLVRQCEDALFWLAQQTSHLNMVIVVGLPVRGKTNTYNSACVIANGEILGIIPKFYLPNGMGFNERRWFSPGCYATETQIAIGEDVYPFGELLFDLGHGCIMGVEICKDLWAPSPPSTNLALQGANLIVNLSASVQSVGRCNARATAISSQSSRCYCAYAYCPSLCNESTKEAFFSGAAMIFENGILLAKSLNRPRHTEITTACVDIQTLERFRRADLGFADCAYKTIHLARTIYHKLLPLKTEYFCREYSSAPFCPYEGLETDYYKDLLALLATALAHRIQQDEVDSLNIMPSTWKNSCATLLICAKAAALISMPPENVVIIPKSDNENRLAKFLGMSTERKGGRSPLNIFTYNLSDIASNRALFQGDGYGILISVAQTSVDGLLFSAAEELSIPKEHFNASGLSTPEDRLFDFFLFHYIKCMESEQKTCYLAKETFRDQFQSSVIYKMFSDFLHGYSLAQSSFSTIPQGINVCGFSFSPRGDLVTPVSARDPD